MSTPICDFVRRYAEGKPVRFHMPGHKGKSFLGFEPFDLTEIDGADELFAPDGIIAQSEKNASDSFGVKTMYSAAGSTLCIQAMMYLTALYAQKQGHRPLVLAGRNAHRAFVSAAAMANADIEWMYPPRSATYHSSEITPETVRDILSKSKRLPDAVYVTSPDYLGNILDIEGISQVCRKFGTLLLTDCAHGSYLKFLPQSVFPTDLGADMCCSSAHKTLPVATGGAYLHISDNAPEIFCKNAKRALSLFASSSPSYLILQSLDLANDYFKIFSSLLSDFVPKVSLLKKQLLDYGYTLSGHEPLKITIFTRPFGYSGQRLAEILEGRNIYPEFYDPDYIVFMLSPQNSDRELEKLKEVLLSIKRLEPIQCPPPVLPRPETVISARQAVFLDTETVPVEDACGRISAAVSVSCPPAIPIAVCGERIDGQVIKMLKYYGIDRCEVVK